MTRTSTLGHFLGRKVHHEAIRPGIGPVLWARCGTWGYVTPTIQKVTCKRCLAMMEKEEKLEREYRSKSKQ